MVKNKIPVKALHEVDTVNIKSKEGQMIWYWQRFDDANNGGTAEEFVAKHELKAIDGKLMLVEKI